ncbi:hypothetical protein GE21DRAFT_188 [Neurospora crassa]|uniref:Uncharacterized protein n=1 Tax=Neurospora crassa (strain ATCC 24698 / 74-OR23-1A / CBS 708.71 / DSM 1257 / FGSC 987) TaxID=367110 RepID=V5IRB1_NEUCR|nr:hypothetical protein NCU09066 [Neurospora crassa OR74A]ESA43776.1 hypothetical protein NCU09066 [Neurospora crassa OR74A]KHE79075.1 hypothetical protein GE21DRAFT_188 [Neurospora crassa]|eukprot:XP_011393224.1 hypothetical protein NCU09066 [Neurospora crassa OR74A]
MISRVASLKQQLLLCSLSLFSSWPPTQQALFGLTPSAERGVDVPSHEIAHAVVASASSSVNRGVSVGTSVLVGLWLAFPSFVRDNHGLDSRYGSGHISSKPTNNRTTLESAKLECRPNSL